MKRVFIGYKCEPFPDLLFTTGKLKKQLSDARIKWVSPEYWHITSHFIGKADDNELEILKEIIAETGKQTNPIKVAVTGIGFFPTTDRPKILWTGVEPQDELSKIYYKTGALLRSEGFKTDSRPYNPHITLARIKHCSNPELTDEIERAYAGIVFGALNINEIILYESRLSPSGAVYIPLFKTKI